MATSASTTGAPTRAPAFHLDSCSKIVDWPLSSRLADVSATMAQAEAVLELIGNYGEDEPTKGSACYGAATIIRTAIDALCKLEVEVRASEREGC